MLAATCHSKNNGWEPVDNLEDLSELRRKTGNLVWAETDVKDLDAAEVELIADEFDLPALAVQDAVHLRQRPKLEFYGDQIFIVVHQLDEIDDQLEASQISGFIGERFLLVFHEGAKRSLEGAKKRWGDADQIPEGPAALVHVLLDVVVDDYQEIADRLEEEMELLEDIALSMPGRRIQHQLYGIKQQVARLRRYVLPGTRLLEWATDPDTLHRPFSDETAHLFRDIHDHLMRITEQVRNVDDLAQAVIDLTQAEQAAVLNENSRRLSAWAAIFAVGTLIAGIYGMNFRLVPGDQTLFGFWFAIGLMVASSGGLYFYFKKRGWL